MIKINTFVETQPPDLRILFRIFLSFSSASVISSTSNFLSNIFFLCVITVYMLYIQLSLSFVKPFFKKKEFSFCCSLIFILK